MAETSHPRKRSLLRTLLVAIGVVVGLVVLGSIALVLLVDSDALAARVKDRVVPQLSERIGREIRVGPIDVDVLPAPSVRIDDVWVQGEGDRPLLASETAVAKIDVWALLRSLGKEIRLESIELRGAEANVIRLPNGQWGYEQILERLKATEEPSAEAGTQRRVAIDRAKLEHGTLRLIDQSAPGGTAMAELQGIELTARNIGPGLPLSVDMKAALQSQTPNVQAHVNVDPMPLDFAALGPGTWPEVTGTLQVRDAPLRTLRNLLPAGLSQVATGGLVRMNGDITTEGDRYVATGSGGVRELQLRGEPAEAAFGYTAQVDPATKALRVDVRDLQVEGPGVDIGGTAQLVSAPMRFEFALAGPLLDLDTLLGVLPQEEKPAEEPDAPAVPPQVRAKLAQAEGHGALKLDRLVNGNLTATNVQAEATLKGGELTLRTAQAQFYGGTVKADGTTANLAEELPKWVLRASMNGVDLGQAMQAIAGTAPLAGTLQSDVDLRGEGVDWEALRTALTGAALLGMENGRFATLNLDQAVAGSLADALRQLGQKVNATRIEKGAAGTALRELRTRVRVDDGWMVLQQPLTVNTAVGQLKLDGRIGLDWRLDLSGTARLTPEFVSQITGGQLRPGAPVTVPLQLGGTLTNPAVAELDTETVARRLLPAGKVERRVEREVDKRKKQAEQEARRRAEDALRGVF